MPISSKTTSRVPFTALAQLFTNLWAVPNCYLSPLNFAQELLYLPNYYL